MIGVALTARGSITHSKSSITYGGVAMEWEPIVTLLELLSENPKFKTLVQVVSLVVLFVGLYRYLLKPTWRFQWKLFTAADAFLKIIPTVLKIAEDFKPNGGNSLRDVVNRIEQRQSAMESKVHALLTTSPGPLFETDADGLWVWANRAMSDLTGYLPDQMIGYGWMNLICQDYQNAITQQWQLAVSQKRDAIFEFDLVTKAERVIPIKLETTIVRDSSDQVVGYIGKVSAVHCSPPPSLPAPTHD